MVRMPTSATVYTSPLGLVPKSNPSEGFCLIVDLSFPGGHSVNDGIKPDICTIQYAAMDQALLFVQAGCSDCLMAEMDLKSAYIRVPVYPLDQPLLTIRWRDAFYTDKALNFGLQSAPKRFSAVADALSWAMVCWGVSGFLHYLDDFFLVGPPHSDRVNQSLWDAMKTVHDLGFPTACHKTVWGNTSLTFLGIIVDLKAGTLSLPHHKLEKLQVKLLIGQRSYASTVVPSGRSFVRHLIDTSTQARAPHHFVRLNKSCLADILWLTEFGLSWTVPPSGQLVTPQ